MQQTIEGPNLQIRFRRGDQWVNGRLCSIGINGVFIATNTPARVGETVDLELCLVDEAALRAAGLSQPELMLSGVTVLSRSEARRAPPGFAAHLRYRSNTQRRDMVTMLRASRGRAPLRPPPQRREARYPISWPILIKIGNKRCRMSALDVSRSGMFVGGAAPLPEPGQCLQIAFPLDGDGDTVPIRGIARVERTIPRASAQRRKLHRGMGLQFCELSLRHQHEYDAFIKRVAFRSTKRIVVSAQGIRLNHLATELHAVGYAVTTVSSSQRLFAVCNDESNTPDLVIFDTSFRDTYPTVMKTAQRKLTARLIASTEFDQPFANPVRALADSILAPIAPAWLDIGWQA